MMERKINALRELDFLATEGAVQTFPRLGLGTVQKDGQPDD
jgi:hypothetical protein